MPLSSLRSCAVKKASEVFLLPAMLALRSVYGQRIFLLWDMLEPIFTTK